MVRQNYESLTLKILDNLDQYERYTEVPKYTSFFTSIVRVVIKDTRQNFASQPVDYTSLLTTTTPTTVVTAVEPLPVMPVAPLAIAAAPATTTTTTTST